MWSKTSDQKIINSQWYICQQFFFQGFLWYTLPETSVLIFKVNLLQGLLTILKIRDNGFLQSSMFSVVFPFQIWLIFSYWKKDSLRLTLKSNVWKKQYNESQVHGTFDESQHRSARSRVLSNSIHFALLYIPTPKWFPVTLKLPRMCMWFPGWKTPDLTPHIKLLGFCFLSLSRYLQCINNTAVLLSAV